MNAADFEFLQPRAWISPHGYSNGIVAQGRQVFIAGQVGWDAKARMVGENLVAQTEQALKNILVVLAEAGGAPHHLTRMNWYIIDKADYIARRKEIGVTYRRIIGKHYPAMSLLVVAGLLEETAKVEIEAAAVIPHKMRGATR
jgi:enamine deaminase RidA (YjgF/YER057c/UK114 family)